MNKFRDTLTDKIILTDHIEIVVKPASIEHYSTLGYVANINDRIIIHPTNLPNGSGVHVDIQCPVCNTIRSVEWRNVIKYNHTLCRTCSGAYDLRKKTFGRLLVIELDKEWDGLRNRWICECECGNLISVSGESLTKGNSSSCGCLRDELSRSRNGENSPNWNRNLTNEERERGRNQPGYTQYIKAVMKRDNWTCQCCSQYGGKLEVHHLYSYSDYPEYRLDVDYGVTLCEVCHDEFHWDFMGSNKNACTPDDYDDWINSK